MVTFMVIKISNVSIDVYLSHSEMTYVDTYWTNPFICSK